MKRFFDREVHLGILKGGQLGRMLLPPCMKLGIIPHIMDNDPDAPARAYCNNFTLGDATAFDDVYNFGKDLDAVTIEVENVNKDALNQLRDEGVTVYPSPELIALVQDKGIEPFLELPGGHPRAGNTQQRRLGRTALRGCPSDWRFLQGMRRLISKRPFQTGFC